MQIIRDERDIEQGLAALLEIDPRLRPVAAEAGALPLRLREPGFEGLAHIIVSQVVSRASADAIWGKMIAGMGQVTAEGYVALAPEAWRTFGLSRIKHETLARVAEAVAGGSLDLHALSAESPDKALAELTSIKGIGPWTAEVYLMFCGGHADVFPAGDVALQAAVGMAFGHEVRPLAKEITREAAVWAPWRSVAARLFWAYYAVKTRRDALPIV
ncbi:DNA-3-methyladenine glycosidase [Rhizobium dioscoreae]|uniref:DNA-3-methyladenine glycosylase II n=2 Tax=Rhizobium/Agrobacterium group TaxID=227290 RepID=A0ABQ0ZC63_9HYPH|nr:DNA-3-methyladenine glycosylase II [Rhizobium sp. ERR1071]GES47353.1 DNA-3-methyladenine glycosidase [Rhizobium dioscoreae]GES52911.1 DNA-3-methyladenine glycosidase [Rhizobium dioscoreae]GLU84305.1 DNA-3-methyladenine glycosidase [Rhizobium sp. NBRC 114257]